jgi:hypothetical protein
MDRIAYPEKNFARPSGMALLVIGSIAATAGAAAYVVKKKTDRYVSNGSMGPLLRLDPGIST